MQRGARTDRGIDVLVDVIRIKIKIFKQSVFIIVKKRLENLNKLQSLSKKELPITKTCQLYNPKTMPN